MFIRAGQYGMAFHSWMIIMIISILHVCYFWKLANLRKLPRFLLMGAGDLTLARLLLLPPHPVLLGLGLGGVGGNNLPGSWNLAQFVHARQTDGAK